jgi:hypothetical protein
LDEKWWKKAPFEVADSSMIRSSDVAEKPWSMASRSAVSRIRVRVALPSRGMTTLVPDRTV